MFVFFFLFLIVSGGGKTESPEQIVTALDCSLTQIDAFTAAILTAAYDRCPRRLGSVSAGVACPPSLLHYLVIRHKGEET